jgi:primosomal protein N'
VALKLKAAAGPGITVAESVPAPLEKAKTYFRFQVSLRGTSSLEMARLTRRVLEALPLPGDVFVAVDVDPLHLL